MECRGITNRLQHWSSGNAIYTDTTNRFFSPLISPVHTVLKGRTLLLRCGGKRRASGMGREGCRGRDGKRSLACVLLASLFQASVPQQLSEERQIKVRRDAPPQESTRLVDLFLGAPCKTYTMSVGGSDVKLESCFCCSALRSDFKKAEKLLYSGNNTVKA